jgi:small-conductance mechanosensitive channel
MDERIASNEKKTKEYNNNLDAAHTKYRQAVAEHDAKIAELSKTHAQEIEKLQRSVKDTEIECERLRTLVAQTKEQFSDTAKDRAQVIEGYKKELADAEKRFKQAALDHDKVIADISKKHLELVDDLRRQLLAANLECDKIRTELASQQMRAAPQEASEIISRTMKSVGGAPKTSERLRQSSPLVSTLRAFGVVLLLHLFAFQQLGFLSLNAMCAPVMPGTVVHEASSFDAPWWVPQSHKETVFGVICGTRPRTQLTWTHKGRLVVTDMEHKEKLLEKKADHVVVQATSVNFYAKNGKIEQSQAPWSK